MFTCSLSAKTVLAAGVGAALTLAAFADTAAPAPDAKAILSTLAPGHPRLLAHASDFVRLRGLASSDATTRGWLDRLHREAEKTIQQEPSKYEIPDGLRLLATSRRVFARVTLLSLTYRLTDDRRFAERAWAELHAAADFPNWNPRHFLDTAEMTAAFAIGYDWLYDFWTPEQRAALRGALVAKGLNAALPIYRKGEWWTKMHHNWNQVCNGGIGLGALAIGDEEPALCGEILHDAVGSIPLAMREFGPDGAWGEGPGYWGYATQYNVLFLAALDSALGADFGLSKIPGFSEAGGFPLSFTSPTGLTFNYADAGESKFKGAPELFWLAAKFNRPAYAAFQLDYAKASLKPLDFLWGVQWLQRNPAIGVRPLCRYFRGPEVFTARSAWDSPDATFIGFKAGDNSVNHGHLDLGSFVLEATGCRWAVDLGSDNYNMPGYFGAKRWTYYRLRAEAHNTLLINPGAGPDQAPKAVCRVIRSGEKPAFAVADLTAAYAPQAGKVERGICMTDAGTVLVQDQVDAEKPCEIWWLMHTRAAVEIAADGKSAVLKQSHKALHARLISNVDGRFEIVPAEPLASSPHPPKQGENQGVRVLAVHYCGVKSLRMAVRLGIDDASPASELKPLRDWR